MSSKFDYVLLGGGTSCGYASASIREYDKDGTILIVSADPEPPYDRPPLSKGFLVNPDLTVPDIHCKDESFYTENNIELKLNTRATAINRTTRQIKLNDNSEIVYGKLLYALGASPRHFAIPGGENILLLRTAQDASKIKQNAPNAKSAVVVGGGYIGAEVSASLRKLGVNVTVIELGNMIWSKFPSKTISMAVQNELQNLGCEIISGESLMKVEDGSVHTDTGRIISADLIIGGIGVNKNTELAQSAGLEIGENGVKADDNLRTDDIHIWVAGDVAYYFDVTLGKDYSAEHHLHAKWTGQHAGKCMTGHHEQYKQVPYFFSDVGELSMILRGFPEHAAQSFVIGDVNAPVITEVFVYEDETVAGVIDIRKDYKQQDPISDLFEKLVANRTNASTFISAMTNPNFDVLKLQELID